MVKISVTIKTQLYRDVLITIEEIENQFREESMLYAANPPTNIEGIIQ